MSETMNKYIVIASNDAKKFISDVNEAMQNNYYLLGQPFGVGDSVCQALLLNYGAKANVKYPDADTIKAIKAFQADEGLEISGKKK
jgi:hypothetical protein